ncbi:hypothetical protein DENSPDRAFT_886101 [Dentipellis sp. KUC8613]|nr:hypothetical protein DENSPDRAFT_886101 [Dentipellis sp. KUC8613]
MLNRFAVICKHTRPSVRLSVIFDSYCSHPTYTSSALFNHFARTFQVTIASSIFALLVSICVVASGLARTLVLPSLFRFPVPSRVLHPLCAHFLKGPHATVLIWEFAESVFDENIHKAHPVSPVFVAPTSVVAGATSLDPYYRYFACWELDGDAAHHATPFADQEHSPPLWPTLEDATHEELTLTPGAHVDEAVDVGDTVQIDHARAGGPTNHAAGDRAAGGCMENERRRLYRARVGRQLLRHARGSSFHATPRFLTPN